MLELIARGPLSAGAVAARFDLSAAAVSQHLKVLRESGLVKVAVDGPRRIYSLDMDGLETVDAWIAEVRRFWSGRLDALEAVLGEEKGDRK